MRSAFLSFFKYKTQPVIVLDPGHGTKNSSVGAYQEAKYNLVIALKMEKILKANGYKVYLTHRRLGQNLGAKTLKGDSILRARFATQKKANIFFHIHSDQPLGRAAVYYPRLCSNKTRARSSLALSRNIWKQLKSSKFPGKKGGIRGEESAGSVTGACEKLLIVSRYSKMPSALVEMTTMTRKNRLWLNKSKNQINMALALSLGIHKTLKPNKKFINPYKKSGY